MQEIVFSFDLVTLSLIFCAVFPMYFFLLKKQIFYWFDPLLVFVFFNSISVAFVIYLFFFMQNIKLEYFLSFSLCIIGFITGVLLGGRKGLPKIDGYKNRSVIKDNSKNYSVLVDIIMILSLAIMLISNLLMLVVKGTLPILSSNPSEAKILLYTGGWGLIKRINFALVYFTLAIPLIKIFHPSIKQSVKKKVFYVACFLMSVLLVITMGSKSSLLIILNLLLAITLVNRTYGFFLKDKIMTIFNNLIIRKWAKYAFMLAIFFMFSVVFLSGVETSSLDTLITRFVASGDAFYFFYVFDIADRFNETPINYIPHILNPLLAMIRLTEYEFAIGAYIINYSVGLPLDAMSTFGPNAQHPIEGFIYFGSFGAPFYSFFIGYLISWVRIGMLRKMGAYPSNLMLVIYVVLSSLVITAGTDFPLFMQIFYDMLIYGIIILILSSIIVELFFKSEKNRINES